MVYVIESLEKFRSNFSIPSWVTLENLSEPLNYFRLAEGHWFPSLFIAECGFSFPPNPLCLEFCHYFDVVPAKIAPNTWRIFNGVHWLNQTHENHIGIPEIMYCYRWAVLDNVYYLKTRFLNRALVVNLPDANRDYFEHGVIIKNWQHAPLTGDEVYEGPKCPPYGNGIGYFHLMLFLKS